MAKRYSGSHRMSTQMYNNINSNNHNNNNNWLAKRLSVFRRSEQESRNYRNQMRTFSPRAHSQNGKGHKIKNRAHNRTLWENQIFIFIGKCHDCSTIIRSTICIAWGRRNLQSAVVGFFKFIFFIFISIIQVKRKSIECAPSRIAHPE